MAYKNGAELLPPKLLMELQKYIQGELIYIPKKTERAPWGTLSGTKKLIQERNMEIYNQYLQGISVITLAAKYCLSEDSIKKIINRKR